jgi:hypothetical protein
MIIYVLISFWYLLFLPAILRTEHVAQFCSMEKKKKKRKIENLWGWV